MNADVRGTTSKPSRPAGPGGGPYGLANLFRFQRDTLGFLAQAAADYGDLVYFRMAAFHFYMPTRPEQVRELLINQNDRLVKWQRQTDTWANAVGHSTLTMEGPGWQRNRRLLNPSFHATAVTHYRDVIVRHTARLLDGWHDGQRLEMMFAMMRTTMGIIADIIFSLDDIERDAAELNEALTAVFEVLTARTTAFMPTPAWLPTPENLRIRRASRTIEAFIMSRIAERRASGRQHDDVLGELMNARDEETGATLSDREIAYELKTLFGAGHETTALMLMWTLYLLAQHPRAEATLFAEVEAVLAGRPPQLDDLAQMPFTEQVLNESMRVFPPAWSLMVRQATASLQLGDYTIPAGSLLLIPMWIVHRNPDLYPQPLRFDPDRFAGAWKERRSRYTFFPFGGGPHVCLGAHLAMFEGRLMLPMLVQHFRYELPPQPKPNLQALLTLRPQGGLDLTVHKRI